jgi:hypothetical protein
MFEKQKQWAANTINSMFGQKQHNFKNVYSKNVDMSKKSDKELCVSCGAETPYRRDTNVALRLYYVEGAGQLCDSCWQHTYIGNV